jgi:WD40 repeat protein
VRCCAIKPLVRTREGHQEDVTAVCFDHSEDHLISASLDYTARVWSVATGHLLRSVEKVAGLGDIRVLEDGRVISCSSDHVSITPQHGQHHGGPYVHIDALCTLHGSCEL